MTLTITSVNAVRTRTAQQNELSFGQNRVTDWINGVSKRVDDWVNKWGPVEPHLTPRINMPLKKALMIVGGLTVAGVGVLCLMYYTLGRHSS